MITKGYRYSTSIVKQLKIFFHLIRKLEPHTLAGFFYLKGEPCKTCGDLIKKIKVAGRGTHICGTCQKK